MALDHKLSAAKAFVGFYHALVGLEAASQDFANTIEPFVAGRKDRIYDAWLSGLSESLDRHSTSFLKALDDLRLALELYDPKLYLLLTDLQSRKAAMLGYTSVTGFPRELMLQVHWEQRGEAKRKTIKSIVVTSIDSDALTAELESLWRLSIQEASERMAQGHGVDWVGDILLTIGKPLLKQEAIDPTDRARFSFYLTLLKDHLSQLRVAREAMGQFIAKNFKIEDLLYVSRA